MAINNEDAPPFVQRVIEEVTKQGKGMLFLADWHIWDTEYEWIIDLIEDGYSFEEAVAQAFGLGDRKS